MGTRKPTPMTMGGKIRLVSPSMHVQMDEIAGGMRLLEEAGYAVDLGAHALDRHTIFGGTDQDRAADIMDAFLDPSVDAVLCTRGGYGCARLIPYLDFDAIVATSKPFFGFSDITTLHIAINRRGLGSYYAPMAFSLTTPKDPVVLPSLLLALQGGDPLSVAHRLGDCVVPGVAEGEIAGGCMRLLGDSLGTANELVTDGKILFIEDVHERPHRVDATFTHLLLAGKLQACAGIVLGEMTDTNSLRDEKVGSPTWEEIVQDRLAPLGIPLIVNYPFGHIKDMLTIPLGASARLDASAGTVTLVNQVA